MRLDPEKRLAPDQLPVLAREVLGVSPDCVRMWRYRGQLVAGDDGKYRLGDVLKCNGDRRRSGKSHRTLVAA